MTYADKVKQEQAEAQEWLDIHGDKIDAVISPERFGDGHVTTESLDEVFEEDVPYVGRNGSGSDVYYKAMQDVHRLEHWRLDRQCDEAGVPAAGKIAGGSYKGNKAHYSIGCKDLDLAKYEKHCERASRRQAWHGLEFLISPRGTMYASTRPSTLAKVRIAYREQIKSENPDIAKAPKVASQWQLVQGCRIALARGGIHRVYDSHGDESTQLQMALKTGLPRKLNSITDVQVERASCEPGPKHIPAMDYLTASDRKALAAVPLATYRARLSVAFRAAGIKL